MTVDPIPGALVKASAAISAAVEGECDGLSIDYVQAATIASYGIAAFLRALSEAADGAHLSFCDGVSSEEVWTGPFSRLADAVERAGFGG